MSDSSQNSFHVYSRFGRRIDLLWVYLTRPVSDVFKWKCLLGGTAVFCTLFSALLRYPGIISDDSMAQYLQAIGKAPLSDAHPPLMALFWRLEITLFHTANLLNLTWISLSTLGLYLFLRLRPCLFSLLLFLLIFLSPVFFGLGGFLYKDIPLSWLLLISSALLFTLPEKNDSNWKWVDKCLISFLLILCCLLRVNGAFIAVPLLIATWWSWKFDFKHLSACLALVILSLPATGWINHHIFKATKEKMDKSLELFDLAGIAFYSSHKHYDPDEENALWTYKNVFDNWETAPLSEKLTACYTPEYWDSFGGWEIKSYPNKYIGWNKWTHDFTGPGDNKTAKKYADNCRMLGNAVFQIPSGRLRQEWIKNIKTHPSAYIKHRFSHFFTAYLGHIDERHFSPHPICWAGRGYFPLGEKDKTYATSLEETPIVQQYRVFMRKHEGLWSNYGIFWLASALSLFTTTLWGKTFLNRFINLLSFSALCYFLAYFFVGIAMAWRYIMPSAVLIIASFLAIYLKKETIGSPKSRKIGFYIWTTLMFWSCII